MLNCGVIILTGRRGDLTGVVLTCEMKRKKDCKYGRKLCKITLICAAHRVIKNWITAALFPIS